MNGSALDDQSASNRRRPAAEQPVVGAIAEHRNRTVRPASATIVGSLNVRPAIADTPSALKEIPLVQIGFQRSGVTGVRQRNVDRLTRQKPRSAHDYRGPRSRSDTSWPRLRRAGRSERDQAWRDREQAAVSAEDC